MSELPRLLDQLRQAFDGEPWSGPALLTTLAGLPAGATVQRPIAGAHSIWEITQHLTVWTRVVRQRLSENELVQLRAAEDWPAPPALPTEAGWRGVLSALRTAHEQLLATAATIPERSLDHRIGSTFDQVQGFTVYATLHGVAQHYLYHAGQIIMLRKALGAT
ncbi:DinB family protein [Hymenobacter sp. BT664]|uniref:DinB family protein n=1 Tax=Hymenobacter montanus TaxID=2771359 RepID=A0A927BBX5_9BACT|nr:DinB family protein [Hymenobacter montanus]MBD2767309.1 DinB family protein [Hymenobacter montanus]